MTDQAHPQPETITDPAILSQRQAAKTVRDCAEKLGVQIPLADLYPDFGVINADGMNLDNINSLLATQIYTLDAAYNRALQEGVRSDYFDTATVRAALQAQKQFCKAVQALERLEAYRLKKSSAPDYSRSESSNEING